MPRGSISPQFFQNELRIYRCWAISFWRELVQNAVDSGATRIDIHCDKLETPIEVQNVVISDNGCGMTKDIIENIYFVLGETTKNGEQAIGGFGRARMITCFAQNGYQLTTGNLLVVGQGFDYTYEEPKKPHKGVELAIDVVTQGINIYEKLTDYLRTCQLPCTVYVNGKLWTEWTYRRQVNRGLSFGTIHANKSQSPQLLVRVNGATMYQTWISAPAQVVVEINQDISRKVLQASRDGMVYPYQGELEQFVNELSINKRSALKDHRRCKSTTFEGKGTFTSKKKPKAYKDKVLAYAGLSVRTLGDRVDGVPHQANLLKSNIEMEYIDYATKLDLFDVVIEDESYSSKVRSKIELYDPRNWDLDNEPVRSNVNGEYRRGLGRLKLLMIWKAACEQMINYLQERYSSAPDEIRWGVGWLFSDDDAARWHYRSSVNYLLLNPCNDDGTMKYSVTRREDLCELISNAAHEVTHIVHNDHDENFANLQTILTTVGLQMVNEIVNHMKKAKDRALIAVSGLKEIEAEAEIDRDGPTKTF